MADMLTEPERAEEISIRRAEAGDATGLADLLRRIGWFSGVNAETAEQTLARVEAALGLCLADDSHLVFVACERSGDILGYASVHWMPFLFMSGPEGYISELFVDDIARGLGVGSRLLQEVEEEARRRGCARLGLINMQSRESYQRGFYLKRGWQERPEAANFIKRLDS